ncbi:hypothetical protein FNV43_RR08824 [Rhamnella rubrinervis]|uniref:Uncharacterized protein n=1 Tax=Rhamnella rubrinervis TaxID=2594499 RepID=A0A8K0MJ59_9ROSA|nr:hypothetical protein FNV43_RR08824 [Rhamnella rubrinervis]
MDMGIDDDTSRPKGNALAFEYSFYLAENPPSVISHALICTSLDSRLPEHYCTILTDAVGNGKAGTAQCLKSAANALEDGRSV